MTSEIATRVWVNIGIIVNHRRHRRRRWKLLLFLVEALVWTMVRFSFIIFVCCASVVVEVSSSQQQQQQQSGRFRRQQREASMFRRHTTTTMNHQYHPLGDTVAPSTRSVISSVRGGGSSLSKDPSRAPVVESLSPRGGASVQTTPALGAFLRALWSLGLGGIAGVISWQFSLAFPFLITPAASKHAFVPAHFSYREGESFFCDSPWTIWTDYGLGVVMVGLATNIYQSGKVPSMDTKPLATSSVVKLRNLCMVLSLLYAVQFSVAGVLHQFLFTLDQRNTLLFRCFWTVVVTMVSASGGAIGAIGSQLAREGSLGLDVLQRWIPGDVFWIGYTLLVVGITVAGKISCQRPAADTFFAGTSQALPTFFLVSVVVLLGRENTAKDAVVVPAVEKLKCVLGFLLNSALLPGYALALYHTDTSIPTINTVMHSWLCLCYTLQGLSLSQIVRAFAGVRRR